MKQRFMLVILITVFTLAGSLIIAGPRSSQAQGGVDTQATAGTAFTYQGQLKNNGTLFSGTCDFQFSLHDAETGGNQIGSQTKTNVAVSNGLFTAELDFGNGAFNGEARWLNIQVRCPAGSGSYTALSPRQSLTAAPYALSLVPGTVISGAVSSPAIKVVNTAGTGWASAIYGEVHDNTEGSPAIYGYSKATSGWNAGVLGGNDSPEGNGVLGYVTADSGWPNGVYGASDNAPDGNGVFGENHVTTGYGTGVLGASNSPDGSGVSGRNNATTGEARGVSGETNSPNGIGVYGIVLSTTNGSDSRGVYGLNNATSGYADGVKGETHSIDGAGVSGYNLNPSGGHGVWGGIDAPDGVGVKGENFATSGWTNGVRGDNNSPEGNGVIGVANSTTGWANGVRGESFSNDSNGVSGQSFATSGWAGGVLGISDSPDGYGVNGSSFVGGIGVFAEAITGTAVYAKSGTGTGTIIAGVDENDAWKFSVDGFGDVYADGSYHCGQSGGGEPGTCIIQNSSADFAEMLPAVANLEAGDVLIVGPDGQLTRSSEPYQTAVVGVYSTQPGYLGGGKHWGQEHYAPLAVAGIIPVKASAENGAIQPGDSLTTSATPGYAMKADPVTLEGITFYPSGVIIGKALEGLESGAGLIQMLVVLQ